jgi:hypothetical protein
MYTQDMYVYISLCCHHAATFNEKSNVHALSTLPSTPLRPPLHIYTYSLHSTTGLRRSFQRAELLVFQRMRTFRSTAEQLPRAGFFLSHFFPAPLQSRVFDVGDVLIESVEFIKWHHPTIVVVVLVDVLATAVVRQSWVRALEHWCRLVADDLGVSYRTGNSHRRPAFFHRHRRLRQKT